MSRRDTIIIAILVNAGLLLILFATAIRSGDKKKENAVELAKNQVPAKESVNSPVSTEELLNEYIAATPSAEKSGTEEVVFVQEVPAAQTITAIPSPISEVKEPVAVVAAPASAVPESAPVVAAVPAPVAAPVAVAPVKEELAKITVKKGDYLEKLAKAHGTTVAALMKENNLTSTSLKIGQVLKVPGKKAPKEPSGAMEGDFYVVKEGDSPWLIANRLNLKLDELLKINNIDEQKAKRLRPGDRLRIR